MKTKENKKLNFINKKYIIWIIILFFVGFLFIFFKNFYNIQIQNFDNRVLTFINDFFINDTNNFIFIIITMIGDIIIYLVILMCVYFIFKNKKLFKYLSFSLIFTWVINFIIKIIFKRPRPIYSIISKPISYSFPSAHAMCSVVFYGLIIYFINKNFKNKLLKVFLNFIFILLISLIGFSRIYLNVHYFSDVMGGFIIGFVILMISINAFKIIKNND